MDQDRELAVLRETVAALQDTRKIADAFQAKYHEQLVECEHLQADVKRAQVFVLALIHSNMRPPRYLLHVLCHKHLGTTIHFTLPKCAG